MKLSDGPERYRAAIIELALKARDKNLLKLPTRRETLVQNQHLEEGGEEEEERVEEDELAHENRRKSQ